MGKKKFIVAAVGLFGVLVVTGALVAQRGGSRTPRLERSPATASQEHTEGGFNYDIFKAAKATIEKGEYFQVIPPVSPCSNGGAMGHVNVRTWKGGPKRHICCCVAGKVIDVTEWADAQDAFARADPIQEH